MLLLSEVLPAAESQESPVLARNRELQARYLLDVKAAMVAQNKVGDEQHDREEVYELERLLSK